MTARTQKQSRHSDDTTHAHDIVAVDSPLRDALNIVELAARRPQCVLITGPTGCGKELLAGRVHARSGRPGRFVAVNCAALNEGLAESALFGHVRGAFTGAIAHAQGAFVEAHRGTLFLDEIGELEASIQAKLLRALEEGSVRAVGASKVTAVDVRVVAATNRDLRKEIAASRFRDDLYFRISTFIVKVPALRDRPRDLDALVDRFHARHDRGGQVRMAPGARRALLQYPWPGNVRELRNVMERVLTLAPDGELDADVLLSLAPELAAEPPEPLPLEATAVHEVKSSLRQAMAKREQRMIRARMASGELHRQELANELGIHRSTLWRKMKRLTDSDVPPSSRW